MGATRSLRLQSRVVRELDLIANAPSLDELIEVLIDDLIGYAGEYMKEFDKYFNAPNRHTHFPYVMRVLIQNDNQGIRALIDA